VRTAGKKEVLQGSKLFLVFAVLLLLSVGLCFRQVILNINLKSKDMEVALLDYHRKQ